MLAAARVRKLQALRVVSGFQPGFLPPSSSVKGLNCQHGPSCLATDSHSWIPRSSLAPDCPWQCGRGPVRAPELQLGGGGGVRRQQMARVVCFLGSVTGEASLPGFRWCTSTP